MGRLDEEYLSRLARSIIPDGIGRFWRIPNFAGFDLSTSLAPAWSLLVLERWRLDSDCNHQRITFTVGICNLCAGDNCQKNGDLALVCVHDSAWSWGIWRDDVHIRVEGDLAERHNVEGARIRVRITGAGSG